jgi:hypothetical protein
LTGLLALGSLVACSKDGQSPGSDGSADDGSAAGDSSDGLVGGAGGQGGSGAAPDLCEGVTCGYHEVCAVEDGAPICECSKGFSGDGCADDIDECAGEESPCGPGSSCTNTQGGFACLCEDDFEVGSNGCSPIDECAANATPCASGASCTDSAGGPPLCECPAGKFGDGTFCNAVDACTGQSCGGGDCQLFEQGFICDCPLGTSGSSCQDAPACADIAFASSALEDKVRSAADLATGALDAQALDLESLFANYSGGDAIADLGGIECLVSLVDLNLRDQNVADLAPLTYLTRLEDLDLTCNPLTDLGPLAGLPRLVTLGLGTGVNCAVSGHVTSLAPLASATHLESLDVGYQSIADLTGLVGLKNLHVLTAAGLTKTNWSALPQLTRLRELSVASSSGFDWGDVLGLPYLRRLVARDTGLTQLDEVAAKNTLREIDAAENEITSLDGVTLPSGLSTLDLSNNSIGELGTLRAPGSLIWLNLWGNELTDAAPLLELGLVPGAELWVGGNAFDCTTAVAVFDELEAAGVTVLHDCPLQ